MISKKLYFNLLIVMMLITTFLPIVSFNLPWKFGSFHLYAILFAFSILLFERRIFFQKRILLTLSVGLLLILVFPRTIWQHMSDWNREGQINEYYAIFMAILTHQYFITTKDFKSYQKIIKIVFVFLVFTSLTSINASFLNPMYARHLTGANESVFSVDDRDYFLRIGGGAYGFEVV